MHLHRLLHENFNYEQELAVEEITKKLNGIYFHFDSIDSVTLDGVFSLKEIKCVLGVFK